MRLQNHCCIISGLINIFCTLVSLNMHAMKKTVLLLAMGTLLFSCDFMFKDRKDSNKEVKTDTKVVVGTDKDAHGCVASAGYRWSQLRNQCIRVFEEGYRLNTIEQLEGENISNSAFVVFEEEGGSRAELFLPDGSKPVMLNKEKDGVYKNSVWSLHAKNGYQLRKKGQTVYAGAIINEAQVIGDDNAES